MTTPASPEERQQMQQLRKLIQAHDLYACSESFLSDTTLLRYVRARDGNVDKAHKMLVNSLEWRQEWKPEDISDEDVKEDIDMCKMYVQGHDRHGRPVVIFRPANDVDGVGSILTKVRFYVWTLEKAIAAMPADEHQMTWLVDMNGYRVGPSDLKRLSLARALLATLQDQYPERVAKLIMVKPPWYFSVLFGMLKPFISKATLSKVVWDKGDRDGRYPLLEAEVDPSLLEQIYGGERPTPLFQDGRRYDDGIKTADVRTVDAVIEPCNKSETADLMAIAPESKMYTSRLVRSLEAAAKAKPSSSWL
eukprot:TRINITY_DN13016_c0_g1_i1.p1 TRINITY_DN13016_c0_g1~~TRINITY_DN13016_c0_g1_i1.p1  ORF type:complete len:306 (+),score=54.81 TRINITY_DN13016_c0_g1_i1:2-919(+)